MPSFTLDLEAVLDTLSAGRVLQSLDPLKGSGKRTVSGRRDKTQRSNKI